MAPMLSVAGDHADWRHLRKGAENTRSISAAFRQEKDLPILSAPLISKGRFFYQAPDAIRWEYISPVKSVALMKGDRVNVFHFAEGSWHEDATPGLQLRQMILGEIRDWVKGRFDGGGIFRPFLSHGPPMQVTLIPKNELKDFLARIDLIFSLSPLSIKEVHIFEPGEGQTHIVFTDVQINSDLPPATFLEP